MGNLGNSLGDVGRFEEAFERAKQTEGIRRELAEKQPDAFTADWATSLGNLGISLRDVGRFDEALERAKQAEGIWRGLAEKQPNAFTKDWATSLSNLAETQFATGNFTIAIDTANIAIAQISPFLQRYSLIYNPWVGFARRVAAESYFKLEKLDQAVSEARLATQIWSEIAALRENYKSVQVAKTYRALMRCEIALAQTESALVTFGRAFDVLRKPLHDNPRALKLVMSELVDLALTIDADAVARAVPDHLLAVVRIRP